MFKYLSRSMESAAIVMEWFVRANRDNVITMIEAAELIEALADIWKIRTSLEFDEPRLTNLEREGDDPEHILSSLS